MLDRIFATISMLGVIAFLGVVLWFVREPDLIIVTVLVIVIGVLYMRHDLAEADDRGTKAAGKNNSEG